MSDTLKKDSIKGFVAVAVLVIMAEFGVLLVFSLAYNNNYAAAQQLTGIAAGYELYAGASSYPSVPTLAKNWYKVPAMMHLTIILTLGFWIARSSHLFHSRFAILLFIFTSLTGLLGATICLMSIIIYLFCQRKITYQQPSEWIRNFSDNKENENDKLYERISFGLDDLSISGVEPFQDILAGGSALQKQMAIAKITRYFRPQFAQFLLQAARDKSAAVRVQAATALAKIEHDFMEKYMELENSLQNKPEYDEERLVLADLYYDYASSDFLDESTRDNFRNKALNIYEAYRKHRQNDEVDLHIASLYLFMRQPQKSMQILQENVESGNITEEALLCYMEAMFHIGNLSQLRMVAKHYASIFVKLKGMFNDVEEIIQAWNTPRREYA